MAAVVRRRRSLLVSAGRCVALVWAMMGFYQVDEQERAVVLRFGKYHDDGESRVCSGTRR